jgi:hypothetical protein
MTIGYIDVKKTDSPEQQLESVAYQMAANGIESLLGPSNAISAMLSVCEGCLSERIALYELIMAGVIHAGLHGEEESIDSLHDRLSAALRRSIINVYLTKAIENALTPGFNSQRVAQANPDGQDASPPAAGAGPSHLAPDGRRYN